MNPSWETILLVERRPTLCRLAPDTVDFLLAHHRDHLEVLPTRRRHRYRVTALGHVGVLVAPRCRFVIRPKIPVGNLLHLLDPMAEVPVFDDRAIVEPGTVALPFLAGRLARLMTERVAAGLHRGYTERIQQGPFLQGRLDMAAQIADPSGRRDQLHSRFDDFSVDVPCNQAARATAERLLLCPLLADDVKAGLRRALLDFAPVRSVPLNPALWMAAEPDRLTEAYRPLLALCRLLVDSLEPGQAAGDVACPAFLLNMEMVFENYVTDGLMTTTAGKVEVQPLYRVNRPVSGQPDFSIRPDLLVRRDGRPWLIVDAKWKRLRRAALVTTDLYQMLAYGAVLGAERLALIYPGRCNRFWTYTFPESRSRLQVIALRVVGTREKCNAAREGLFRRLVKQR